MLHLPNENKEDKLEQQNKVVKDDTKVNENAVNTKPAEKDITTDIKYNGLYAFDVVFQTTKGSRFSVLVIARTKESAKNRVKDLTDIEKILMVNIYPEKTSKTLVEKEKKAGIYKEYIKKLD